MKRAIKLYSDTLPVHHLCPSLCSFYHASAEEVCTCCNCEEEVSVALNNSNCFLYLPSCEQLKCMLEQWSSRQANFTTEKTKKLALDGMKIFMVANCVWFSRKKTNTNNGNLKPFVSECEHLSRIGISVQYHDINRTIRVNALLYVSDSIAKPLLRNSSQFNGKFGCGLCYHPVISLKRGKGYARSYSIHKREYPLRKHEATMNLNALTATADKNNQGIF